VLIILLRLRYALQQPLPTSSLTLHYLTIHHSTVIEMNSQELIIYIKEYSICLFLSMKVYSKSKSFVNSHKQTKC